MLSRIMSVMREIFVRHRNPERGDLVRFTTVVSGTGFDKITGSIGVVMQSKSGKVSLLICERVVNNIPVGCVKILEQDEIDSL